MCQTTGTDISCCLIDICFRVCHCNIERLQWPIIISINYWHFLKRNYDLHSISTIYDFSSEKFHLFQFMSIILVFVFSLDSILYCKARIKWDTLSVRLGVCTLTYGSNSKYWPFKWKGLKFFPRILKYLLGLTTLLLCYNLLKIDCLYI